MNDYEELTRLIVEFYEKLSSWEHAVVRGKGVSLSQIHILELLGAHEALRMKELSEKVGVTTGTLTVVVDKLVKKGLVCREADENDRRSVIVKLTEDGIDLYREHDRLHLDLTREITSAFNPDELTQLQSFLERMTKRF
ncbi:MarR family winged helix-turn-helix transcriptional regulator [Maridesulfovibrio bastinii]|jgi:DNA-binding MarR family transcriptional regulator|uniref:MarR family winged helix-turn-helix transcriptional regulator n=1 Tax=Maridesulfovibrio bastinii TaxID=47157 RepID=UPI00041996A2|nr:MarR family transcriptional regulator [Maridesulfovibrio bastinii]